METCEIYSQVSFLIADVGAYVCYARKPATGVVR